MFVDSGERLNDLMNLAGFTVTDKEKAHKKPMHREEIFITSLHGL